MREQIKTIVGFNKITIIESQLNKGLANSTIEEVTQIINQCDQAVLLSDLNLTLTEQDANLLLHHYDNDKAHVSIVCLGCFELNSAIL